MYDTNAQNQARTDVTRVAVGTIAPLSLTSSSAQTAVMPADTQSVRLVATVDCFVEIDANPTAVASGASTSFFLPANSVEYLTAVAGQKVAGIRSAVDGTLYVRPCN